MGVSDFSAPHSPGRSKGNCSGVVNGPTLLSGFNTEEKKPKKCGAPRWQGKGAKGGPGGGGSGTGSETGWSPRSRTTAARGASRWGTAAPTAGWGPRGPRWSGTAPRRCEGSASGGQGLGGAGGGGLSCQRRATQAMVTERCDDLPPPRTSTPSPLCTFQKKLLTKTCPAPRNCHPTGRPTPRTLTVSPGWDSDTSSGRQLPWGEEGIKDIPPPK